MAKVNFTSALAEEYRALYRSCMIESDRFNEVDDIIGKILANRSRYEHVADEMTIPWYLAAAIHNMESGLNFSRHLHNGDALDARTMHVPAGRPVRGTPPFTWEESAIDALKLRKLDKIDEWSTERMLYEIEGYNGWGYRLYHAHVLSPYLWSFSNHYVSGKYTADGRWSDTAKSKQCGAAVIIRRLEDRQETELINVPEEPLFFYSSTYEPRAKKLQEFLNRFDGITLRVDGWPGEKTSDAVNTLFGFYLKKDPRNNAV
jgi:lysozyme family protein